MSSISRLARAAALLTLATMVHPGASARLAAADFIRGDADHNGTREITDAIFTLNFLFSGGRAPVCVPIADSNGDGTMNLSDAIYLLGHLFLGGPAPPDLSNADVSACGGLDPAAIARGWKEFESDDPDGNLFSCASCHSMSNDSTAEVLRPGYSLLNSLVRPSYKEGHRANYVGAVNVCRKDWMAIINFDTGNYEPWTESEPRFKDLVAFIASLSTADTSPALQYQLVAPAKTGPSTGNAEEGCKIFSRACTTCHGIGGTGNNLGPTLVDVTPDCTTKPDLCLDFSCLPDSECLDNPDHIRYRIRLSGPITEDSVYTLPPGTQFAGSTMPFWTGDKLLDAQVEDLVAYIIDARQRARDGMPAIDCESHPGPDGVAQRRGALETKLHAVAGTVEELDTRRLRFTGFSYDGRGIEVRVFLSKSDDATSGRAIGPDLFGRTFTDGTLVVELPADVASSSFDTVSIRCVAGSRDLGTAKLTGL